MKNYNKLSVFQGRHVSEGKKNIQVFPKKDWIKDLELIKKNEIKNFHWIVDKNINKNPIIRNTQYVKKQILKFDLKILSICCDYFMFKPVLEHQKQSVQIFKKLFKICKLLNIKYLEIPFFKSNRLKNKAELQKVANFFNNLLIKNKLIDLKICFESDLNFERYNFLLDRLKKKFCYNIIYDTGNSYGIDRNLNFGKEFKKLKKYINFIHIKDASKLMPTSRLGYGKVDFKKILKILKKNNYNGYIVLQTARSKNDFLEIKRNIYYLKRLGFQID